MIVRVAMAAALASLFWLSACDAPESEKVHVDYLIAGGTVVDGTGQIARQADIGIKGDHIVFVGDATNRRVVARQTVDASGLVIAPGFIDPHTHAGSDLRDPERSLNTNYLTQGVTTVFVGNDGRGEPDVEAASSKMTNSGIGTNVAYLVGHGTIRQMVMKMEDRAPTDAELQQMKDLVAKAMDAGAFGLSSGLYYVPGNFAALDEVVDLAREAATRGGFYESHIRDESSYTIGLVAAIEEAIAVGRKAGLPVHIAHIKALGVDVWGQSEEVIRLIEAARAEGVRVTADQYPWLASGTRISNAVIPRDTFAGGLDAAKARLTDPDALKDLRPRIADNIRRRGGAEALLITGGDANVQAGRTLADEAVARGQDAVSAAVGIVLEGDARLASFNMNEGDVERFMIQPWLVTSSDGSGGHPRKYGSFPEKYRVYVKEKQLLSIEEFVHQSSGRTADILGLCNRGLIKVDMVADIVVFDPEGFRARANYLEPELESIGVEHLFVAGTQVIEAGKVHDVRMGRPLLRQDMAKCK